MRSIHMLHKKEINNQTQIEAIRNIYGIATIAIHAEEDRITDGQMEFVKKIAPRLIEELRNT